MDEMEQMSGESYFKKAPSLKLNEIRFNGQTGEYILVDVLSGTKEINGKSQYAKSIIGNKLDIIFLKIRRKLVSKYEPNATMLSTNEHNTASDYVTLYGDEIIQGTAKQMSQMFDKLRTHQVVYAISPTTGDMVRLIVKGASLGSKSKPKDVISFYDYIASFKKDGRNGHFYECITHLGVRDEVNQAGMTYKVMSLQEGAKLTPEQIDAAKKNMRIAFDYCNEVNEFYANPQAKKEEVAKEEVVDYVEGEEDINPEDMKF